MSWSNIIDCVIGTTVFALLNVLNWSFLIYFQTFVMTKSSSGKILQRTTEYQMTVEMENILSFFTRVQMQDFFFQHLQQDYLKIQICV